MFGTAKRHTKSLSNRTRRMVLGLVALVSLLATGCQGELEGGSEADSTVSQSVTGTTNQAFPLSETGSVVVDDGTADFKLDQGETYHGVVRTTRVWDRATGYQGTALTAPAGPSTNASVGSAAFAQWSTTASKGKLDVYTYVSPARGLTPWAVYCVYMQNIAAPTCTHIDQSTGEARWVYLGTVEATGAIQVVLDPTASPADGTQVQADAVAFVPVG